MRKSFELDQLGASVIAVPPLCRDAELAIAAAENRKLIRHIESGGVRILLYGGNANLYHIAVSEYGALLDLLEEAAGADTLVVPSVGPSFGNLMDQAAILRGRAFPMAMVLPTLFPAHAAGIKRAVRMFAERAGMPVVLYLKDAAYPSPQDAAELVGDGIVAWIKYAIVRDDPAEDAFLRELLDLVDPAMVVSGIGEQPAIVHLRDFGVAGFTSGCVCVAPARSMEMLRAIKQGDIALAEEVRTYFRPLEEVRNARGPIPVLHEAVAAAGIADTGPILPMLASLPEAVGSEIQAALGQLLPA